MGVTLSVLGEGGPERAFSACQRGELGHWTGLLYLLDQMACCGVGVIEVYYSGVCCWSRGLAVSRADKLNNYHQCLFIRPGFAKV